MISRDISGEILDKADKDKVLVIGATCVDVVLHVDSLPVKGGHCRVESQQLSLGGCAFNVANILRQRGMPVTFITPVGTGIYGEFVEKGLKGRGFPVSIRTEEENGCCYCFIEPDGERSFIPYHGGEYAFRKEWMRDIRPSDYRYVYICGIEINEPTGEDIVSWLEEISGPEIFFAPSPHITEIKPDLTERICYLHPILHLSEDESLMMSGEKSVKKAALSLREKTGNAVIVTLGDEGALCLEKEGEPYNIPVDTREAVDTLGAGDAHAGALISALSEGLSLREAVAFANETAAAVVTVTGAALPDEYFQTRSAIS